MKTKETQRPAEVCIDPYQPIAREYNLPGYTDSITEPNLAPSLYQMITTATAGSMPGNSSAYYFPDMEEDDHDFPDLGKIPTLDPVEREQLLKDFMTNPNNYEKKEETISAEGDAQAEPQAVKGETNE